MTSSYRTSDCTPGRCSFTSEKEGSADNGYRLGMLAWDPSDDDIEDLVIDALEALPAPFRDQLGSVAIVIEDEATPGQLESGRGTRPVRAVPGRPADPPVRRRGPVAEQDHDLPRAAGPRQPLTGAPGRCRDRHRLPRDRPPFRDLRRAAPRASGGASRARLTSSRPRLPPSRISGRAGSPTTGTIRSTHRPYWAPLGWRPSRATSDRSCRGPQRQVEDVDERDPRVRRRAAPSSR